MTSRPRILYLASSWPRGKAFGGQLRALHVGRALKHVGEVRLVVVSAEPATAETLAQSAEEFQLGDAVLTRVTPNESFFDKLRWAADPRFLNVHGCSVSPADAARVDRLCAEHDLVWILNSRTPNILGRGRWPHGHLDVDDIPSTYLRAVAQNGPRPMERWKARVQQVLSKRRERLFRHRFSTLSVCSEEDRRYLGGGDAIHVIPNGFERPSVTPNPAPASQPPRIGFIGLYSYPPNHDGVQWFLREAWPLVRQAVPGVRFRLIGKDSDGPLKPRDPDVDVLGWVKDPAAEIDTWSAMVIPIRFGGGTRIKIADAFSRKCPVVSTSLGAFGYAVENGRQLRLADSPAEFAAACIDLVKNPREAAAMAGRAWQEFLEKWTWDAIAPRVWAAAEDCLRRSRGAGVA